MSPEPGIAQIHRSVESLLGHSVRRESANGYQIRKCSLCQERIEHYRLSSAVPWLDGICVSCAQATRQAEQYRKAHFRVPKRYRLAHVSTDLKRGTGYLLIGEPGAGKTHSAYAALLAWSKVDPRLKVAAYPWGDVLEALRRGYRSGSDAGQEMVDALRSADVAMIDDLGIEKITDTNAGWLREILFNVLNERYNEIRTTVLTSNLEVEQLTDYFGDRIARRVGEMCKVVKLQRQEAGNGHK